MTGAPQTPNTQLPDPTQQIGPAKDLPTLRTAVTKWLKLAQQQVNRLSSGTINGSTTASTSPPAVGSVTLYAQGDFIRNSAPTELGSAGSKYVVIGWICVAGGQPGTWVACRCSTGN